MCNQEQHASRLLFSCMQKLHQLFEPSFDFNYIHIGPRSNTKPCTKISNHVGHSKSDEQNTPECNCTFIGYNLNKHTSMYRTS